MGVLYTEEAFELCKRLEFKNMLSRFECQGPVNRVSENFRKVSDLAEAEKIFETAAKAAHAGSVSAGAHCALVRKIFILFRLKDLSAELICAGK